MRVVVAEAGTIEAHATTMLVATVEPVRRSKVASEIAGIVEKIPIRQGDRVDANAVLCQLNADSLRFQLAEAKAKRDALQSVLDELEAGTRKEELVRLEALAEEAVAEFDRWKFEVDRVRKLYEGQESNAKEFTDATASFRVAERRMIAAKANHDLGVEGPRKEVVASARHEVREQQAVVDRIKSELDKTTIRAPYRGFVVRRNVEVGEWVSAGGPIVELVDLSSVLVRVDVPESALPYIREGTAARVKVDALGRSFDGTIKHIMRDADRAARTYPVEIEVPNPEFALAGGMFARATIPSGEKVSVVAVPRDAVVERHGVAQIGVIMPGEEGLTAILVSVTVGVEVGGKIAVTSGNVKPGTQVVTHGTERLFPFPTPVIIVDETGTPVPKDRVTGR